MTVKCNLYIALVVTVALSDLSNAFIFVFFVFFFCCKWPLEKNRLATILPVQCQSCRHIHALTATPPPTPQLFPTPSILHPSVAPLRLSHLSCLISVNAPASPPLLLSPMASANEAKICSGPFLSLSIFYGNYPGWVINTDAVKPCRTTWPLCYLCWSCR